MLILFYFRWAHQLSTRNFILFCRGFSLRCWRPTVVQLSLYTAWVRPCQRESTHTSSSSICWCAQREEWLHMVSHRHFPFLIWACFSSPTLKKTQNLLFPLMNLSLHCHVYLLKLFLSNLPLLILVLYSWLVHIFVC